MYLYNVINKWEWTVHVHVHAEKNVELVNENPYVHYIKQ